MRNVIMLLTTVVLLAALTCAVHAATTTNCQKTASIDIDEPGSWLYPGCTCPAASGQCDGEQVNTYTWSCIGGSDCCSPTPDCDDVGGGDNITSITYPCTSANNGTCFYASECYVGQGQTPVRGDTTNCQCN